MTMHSSLEKNIFLYPWFIASSSLLFWFPVFFLYFSSKVTIDQVLLLEAIYYIFVVILEVPSGYVSDLYGRRITLITSSSCAVLSYLLFFIADNFLLLVFAQGLLAAHISFKSGTDSSLLFESLDRVSRQSELTEQLAKAQRFGLLATSLAALIGGFFGGFNLALPYTLSAMGALMALFLSLKFIEPVKSKQSKAQPVLDQFKEIRVNLKKPVLRWLFIFSILIFILVHVPYEYFQAYIKLLFPDTADYDKSPIVGGFLIALTMLAGSLASNYSVPLQKRFGTGTALLIVILIALMIISFMAMFLHTLILLVIFLRSVPMALSNPIIHSVIHENINDNIRASFLSTLSLFSRAAFSLSLIVTAVFTGSLASLNFSHLQLIFSAYVLLAVLIFPLLWTRVKNLN